EKGFRTDSGAFQTLQTGQRIDEKKLARLAASHEAVFLAPGADACQPLGVPGEDLKGVLAGLAFLRSDVLQRRAKDADVVVIGGGNTALDSARLALRAGARRVRILYRRTRDEMPAFADEVAEAGAEGVEIELLLAPVAFLGTSGRLEGVRLISFRLTSPGPDGRLRPVPVDGSEKELACDLAIIAAGQTPRQEPFLQPLRWKEGRVWVDGWNRTSQPKLYAGGDLAPTRASVVDALSTGKRAALGIHLSVAGYLNEEALQAVTLGTGPAFSLTAFFKRPEGWQPNRIACPDPLTLSFAEPQTPVKQPEADPQERVRSGNEVSLGLTESQAIEEAGRCLCCGTCTGCDRCLTFCPEGVIVPPDKTGEAYRVNNDYCKGCSICASVCVRGVMEEGGAQ
ncbi:MAG: FAD-dependent oxidoreductase, partial [Desulfobacterales bacterium]|nr:FAD-dependent oxidoreductase [Desulfobacterales bacterium]